MTRYVLGRLAQAVPVLFIASVVIFLIVHVAPGDPATSLAGIGATPDQIVRIRAYLGLDKPLWEQYVRWLGHAVKGDFGDSTIYHLSARHLIEARIPATAELAGAALTIAIAVGIPLGIAAARKPGGIVDRVLAVGSASIIAVPPFWLGIIGILVFGLYLGWLPSGGYVAPSQDLVGFLKALVLPALVLSSDHTAMLARFVRSGMIETRNADYMRTAVAKGLPARIVILRHQFRNSLTPVITVLGLYVGRMLGGAVVIETVFAWPGVGRLLGQSVAQRDYAITQGILVMLVAWFVFVNLLTDLAYGWADPRIRLQRGARLRRGSLFGLPLRRTA